MLWRMGRRASSTTDPPTGCPRCGYDLSGSMAAWTQTCPLRCTCSECGLEFRVSDVLGETARGPRWHFEAPKVGQWRRLVPGTMLRAVRPARFWKAIPLALPVRRGRIALVVALLVLTLQGIVSGAAALDAHFLNRSAAAAGLQARVSLVDVALGGWTHRVWVRSINGGRVGLSPQAFVVPLAAMSMCTLVGMVVLGRSLAKAKVSRRHLLRPVVPTLGLAVVGGLLVGLAASAREELRAGLVMAMPHWSDWLTPATLAVLAVGFFWWWYCFVRFYLRLRHPWAVALLSMIIGVLLPLAIGAVLSSVTG